MGNRLSVGSIKNYKAIIHTSDKQVFELTYHALVEHIFLLRKVIQNPRVTTQGYTLNRLIEDYYQRMKSGQMDEKREQEMLPWEIEWIWHVHRLHPIAYLNDCKNQLPDGLVDKQTLNFITKTKTAYDVPWIYSFGNQRSFFYPSIDLSSAINRQREFLDKFRKHFLFSCKLEQFDELRFENLIQNYVSFVKLGKKNQMIVPTLDIDLVWHTHMRYPSDYHQFSKALCGFILDHDDAIESSKLAHAYKETADRWKKNYQTDYGKIIDRNHLEQSQFKSSCAMVQRSQTSTSNNGHENDHIWILFEDEYQSTDSTAACAGGCASCGGGCGGGCGGCGG